MRILIIGASGFIGRAIYEQLNKKHMVYGTYYRKKSFRSNPNMFYLNLSQEQGLKKLLYHTEPDLIISSMRGNFEQQMKLHQELLAIMRPVTDARLIFLSTSNVFDKNTDRAKYEVDAPQAESDYGIFKIACEKMFLEVLKDRCAVLRPSFVWGKNCPRIRLMRTASKEHKKIPTWSNLFSNHTLDVQIADYVEFIIKERKSGIFHVGSTDVIDYTQFITEVCKKCQFKQPEFDITTFPEPVYRAVLSDRADIPKSLQWTSKDILQYLARNIL